MTDVLRVRARMVRRLRRQGITDERVLAAMAAVPRERFVPAESAARAHGRRPLRPAECRTISSPWTVAAMAQALGLTGTERVLEVGGGSGYAAAVLANCAREVVTVERHAALAEAAARTLDELGYRTVEVRHDDGTVGAADRSPFDAISVAAMAQHPVGFVPLVEG